MRALRCGVDKWVLAGSACFERVPTPPLAPVAILSFLARVMPKGFAHVHPFESKLIARWAHEKKTVPEIAALLGRHRSTIAKHLRRPARGSKVAKGRPRAITQEVYASLKKALARLLRKASAQIEVTVCMVKAAAGCSASDKTVREAFHARGVRFRKLREKPLLTADDVVERRAFAEGFSSRSANAWVTKPHAIIDNKNFPMYLDRKGREHAASRQVRGAYRQGRDACVAHLVKPKASLKFPSKNIVVTAAVIKGRIRMWHYTKGSWNGNAAAAMYSGPLARAMKRAYPGVSKFQVCEDNDPSGYKARKGIEAKAASKISTLGLPRRSPDLNVLDYSLWHAINVRMRKQEAAFPAGTRESEEEFKTRLRKVALSMPTSVVTRAVKDMTRRVRALRAAKGRLISE